MAKNSLEVNKYWSNIIHKAMKTLKIPVFPVWNVLSLEYLITATVTIELFSNEQKMFIGKKSLRL